MHKKGKSSHCQKSCSNVGLPSIVQVTITTRWSLPLYKYHIRLVLRDDQGKPESVWYEGRPLMRGVCCLKVLRVERNPLPGNAEVRLLGDVLGLLGNVVLSPEVVLSLEVVSELAFVLAAGASEVSPVTKGNYYIATAKP